MKVKRTLSALLCSGMLMLSAMPVSAADCSHSHWSSSTSNDAYQSIDSEQHEIFCIKVLKCEACHKLVSIKESKGTESHSRVTVADLGHVGAFSHKYRTECTKCGYSVDVIVPCADH